MKLRRVFGLVLFALSVALTVGPSARLLAASPCRTGAAMACCRGTDAGGGDAAPPCGCTLKPVTPPAAVVEQAAAPVVLAEAPAAEVPAPDATSALRESPAPPRARAGPLFLRFSSLLN